MKKATIGVAALISVLALAATTAPASAHITNNAQHLLEHVLEGLAAIQAKTDALPPDPAATSDIEAAREQLLAAVGRSGFFPPRYLRGVIGCVTVVPSGEAGVTRLVTMSLFDFGPPGDWSRIHVRHVVGGRVPVIYPVYAKDQGVSTFVDSVTGGENLEVCNPVGAPQVAANWVEVRAATS